MKRMILGFIVIAILLGINNNLFAIEEGDDVFFLRKIRFSQIASDEEWRKIIFRATAERVTKRKIKVVADAVWLGLCKDRTKLVNANSPQVEYPSNSVGGTYGLIRQFQNKWMRRDEVWTREELQNLPGLKGLYDDCRDTESNY